MVCCAKASYTVVRQKPNAVKDEIYWHRRTRSASPQDTDNGLQTHRQRTILFWRYVLVVMNDDRPLNPFFFSEASTSLPLPAVLTAPIRLDVVQQVHSAYDYGTAQIDGLFLKIFREHREEQKAGLLREREGWPPN